MNYIQWRNIEHNFHNNSNIFYKLFFHQLELENIQLYLHFDKILINTKDINDSLIPNEGILLPYFCYFFYWENIQRSEKGKNLIN